MVNFKGRTIRKLMVEAGEVKKNIRARENLVKNNSCMLINPKKYSGYSPKKNSYKEFDDEKNSCSSKFSTPPPPLKATFCFSFCFQSFAQLINSAIY